MSLKLILKNRYNGKIREVSQEVWEGMQKDGRSRFWSANHVLEEQPKPEIKPFASKPKKEKVEKIKIENILKDEPKVDEINEKPFEEIENNQEE